MPEGQFDGRVRLVPVTGHQQTVIAFVVSCIRSGENVPEDALDELRAVARAEPAGTPFGPHVAIVQTGDLMFVRAVTMEPTHIAVPVGGFGPIDAVVKAARAWREGLTANSEAEVRVAEDRLLDAVASLVDAQ